jgi:hypothetical protein
MELTLIATTKKDEIKKKDGVGVGICNFGANAFV